MSQSAHAQDTTKSLHQKRGTHFAAGLDFAEVWVAQGVYAPKCADDPGCAKPQDASFALADGVRVYGGFAGSESVRDDRDWAARLSVLSGDLGGGLHALHVVTGANDTRLDGFVVRDGRASGSDDDTYDDDDVAAVADDPGAGLVDDPGSVETPGDDALALDGDDVGAQPATPSLDFGGDAEGTDDQMAVELSGDANDACGGGLLTQPSTTTTRTRTTSTTPRRTGAGCVPASRRIERF